MVASNDGFYTSDATAQPRPPYQPVTPIEQAVAWNPSPQPTMPPAIDTIAPSAGALITTVAGTPLPPNLPPQRRMAAYEPAITRTRATGMRHPGIPVSTLESNDIVPKPAYGHQPVQAQMVPVKPTSIFVQAGSYTSTANAQKAAQQVANLGPAKIVSAQLGGQPYYRVRIGPIESVEKADALVNTLQRQGRQASIVVSEN